MLENLLDYSNNTALADPEYNVEDFIPVTIDRYYNDDRSYLCAYPFKSDVQIIFYRKDLMEDPEEQLRLKKSTVMIWNLPKAGRCTLILRNSLRAQKMIFMVQH